MLYFNNEDVRVCQESCLCRECKGRKATWTAKFLDGSEIAVCAYCLLYAGKTVWGHENRHELVEAGRAAQEQAVKHNQPMPALDERGRLHPADAEKFAMGVSFTSRMMVDRL